MWNHVHDLAKSLNDSKQIDSILLDFSKAFDKVSHGKLCLKLQHHGIRGKLLKWVEGFFYNQTQKVVVSGEESLSVSVTSGVPQGTVVEPMICQIPPPLLRRPLNGQNLLSLTKVFFMLPKSLSTKECPTELSFWIIPPVFPHLTKTFSIYFHLACCPDHVWTVLPTPWNLLLGRNPVDKSGGGGESHSAPQKMLISHTRKISLTK